MTRLPTVLGPHHISLFAEGRWNMCCLRRLGKSKFFMESDWNGHSCGYVSEALLQRKTQPLSYTQRKALPLPSLMTPACQNFKIRLRAFSTHTVYNKICNSCKDFCTTARLINNFEVRLLGRWDSLLGVSSFNKCHSLQIPANVAQVASRGLKTHSDSQSFVNPILELQRFVSVPIIPEDKAVFNPSDAEISEAKLIYKGRRANPKDVVSFMGCFIDGSELPDLNLPEVCFLGRSNVGKSSLISFLLNAHPQVNVSVSKKPGHTKKLNLYRIGHHFSLVDMPGYGYNMPGNFQRSVETYLSTGRRLCRTFLLVDGEVGLTPTDNIALDMLHEFGIPYVVVLTKIDKAGRHKLVRNLLNVMTVCSERGGHTFFGQPFIVSSKTGDGMPLLQTFIAYITGCVHIKGL